MRVEYITAQQIDDSTFEAECPFCQKHNIIEKIRRFTKISVAVEYRLNIGCRHCLFFDPTTKVIMFAG